jgi:hypothetical protein
MSKTVCAPIEIEYACCGSVIEFAADMLVMPSFRTAEEFANYAASFTDMVHDDQHPECAVQFSWL